MMTSQLPVLAGLAFLAAVAVGCSEKSELYCTLSQPCTAGHPVCDVEGVCPGSDHITNTCIPEACWDASVGAADAAPIDANPADADPTPDADPLEPCTVGIVFETANGSIGYVQADGAGYRALTSQNRNKTPRWSPDGRRVAFVRSANGVTDSADIWVMQANGTLQTQLTTAAGDDSEPSWSADGGKIGFTSERLHVPDSGTDAFAMDSDGLDQHFIDEDGAQTSWSPSGRIAYATYKLGAFEVFSANANGTGLTNLSNDSAADTDPKWSPDGSKIAFNSFRGALGEVFVMDANGSNQVSLSAGIAGFAHVWSPDGSKVAFQSGADIYVVDANGANRMNLTQSAEEELHPTWSPDGTQLIFSREVTGAPVQYDLYRINVNGTGLVRITMTDNDSEYRPHWSSCDP